MPGNNLTDIEKKIIDQQVAEWKRMIYAQRSIGIDVDTLNTKLAVKHDDGEVWEILIKCKRIAEPVKAGMEAVVYGGFNYGKLEPILKYNHFNINAIEKTAEGFKFRAIADLVYPWRT